jgi:flagellar assembly protein FliH
VTKKFQFENSFDANEHGMTSARDFTLEDIEEARQQGFEDGKATGVAEAKAAIDRSVADALTVAGQGLETLGPALVELRAGIEAEALQTVTTIVRKIVPYYAQTHGYDEVEALLRDCLSAAYDEPRIVVRAHDSVLGSLTDHLDDLTKSSGFNGNLVLFEDQDLAPGDCRVEWADGGAERDIKRVWENIELAITRFTQEQPAPESSTAAELEPQDA